MFLKKNLIGLGLLAAPLAAGCGAGGAAEAVRADAPTANKALEEASCHEIEKGGEPLIVDWKTEQRGDLEVAMKSGVAIVSYSCKGIKVLSECKLDGEYGFIGMTRREQVVRLKGADEMKANLPLSGGTIGGGLERGSTLDIAMMLVGKKRTTWDAPTKEDLKGTCDGATHFVRGAMVGAFAMSSGSDAKVRAAAEIFGVGSQGASSSSKQNENRDGNVADCQKSSPDADKAPPECGAPVRLVLAPIAAKAPAAPAAPAPADAKEAKGVEASEKTDCPKGLVFAEGKCAKPEAVAAYECDPSKLDECKAQCDKGNAPSCGALGESLALKKSFKDAGEVLKKGCDGGHVHSCAVAGALMVEGSGRPKDVAGAVPLFEKSCQAGDALGCKMLGKGYQFGDAPLAKDEARAAALYKQACNGGDEQACAFQAALLDEGKGVPKDQATAGRLYKRACDGGVASACANAGRLLASGPLKNEILAEMAFQRGCIRQDAASCAGLGRVQFAKRPDDAKRNFQQACNLRDQVGCAATKVLFGGNAVVVPTPQVMNDLGGACRANMGGYECASLGLLDVARGQGAAAKFNLQSACQRGDAFACAVGKKVP